MRHGFIRRWLRVALSAASICLVAVTSLIGGGGPASAQNWVCQGATTQNRHCYAQTIWGVTGASGGGTPVSFSEIGADLEIDCLSIGNLSTDFINYEMWMYTNTNFQHPMATWVEGGYARGGSAIGNLPSLSVFRFWADQRSTTGLDYAEHFIGNATPGQYIDTGFQWVPNTGNWRVYSNHTQVGTSVNVGAWAGGADLGLEFTDTQSAGVTPQTGDTKPVSTACSVQPRSAGPLSTRRARGPPPAPVLRSTRTRRIIAPIPSKRKPVRLRPEQ